VTGRPAATSRPGTVRVLGTHGVPAAYGGFETAAQHIGLHLAHKGWRVIVYCQVPGTGPVQVDRWRNLERVLVPEPRRGWLGTASFDLTCVRHVLATADRDDVCLTFGYNTGVFSIAQRLRSIPNVINMDGMEWTRRRWGPSRQAILLANERAAGALGTLLIADHPQIARYLRRHFGSRRVRTIAYGAHPMHGAAKEPLQERGLVAGQFATMICRPIPENSCLEIVQAWSARRRPIPLVVLGAFDSSNPYHAKVLGSASRDVRFLGAIYEDDVVASLRYHSRAYLHGHTVGGTNPSLVEAMAAGNAVIAQNNVYNRFVAGVGNRYFDGAEDLAELLDLLLEDTESLSAMGEFSRRRHGDHYTWDRIGDQYEEALLTAAARHGRRRV
jgi:glycosyltransferase involved in cell wall biosynthesis